jgi:dTDP-glucose pyrophosphorylase
MAHAIDMLDKEALRIVLVVNTSGKLLGTITDGDIRRALINQLGMNTELRNVMFCDPTVASVKDDKATILKLMKKRDLLQIPILDANGIVVGLENLHRLLENRKYNNPVFLMAGGFGKRLKPLTNDVPKPLLKVGTKPILEIILEQFIKSGFYNFYISTHYKAEMVRTYFDDGRKWGVEIQYIHEEEPLGTAGSLGLLPNDVPELPLIMMNGDLLTNFNFERLLQFHSEQKGIATVCVREYDLKIPYGVVESEDIRIKRITEKPVHKFFVNAGIYVLEPDLVHSVQGNEYIDMPNLIENEIKQGCTVNMFPIHEYWLDIGQMDEYEKAQGDISGIFK